jgi:hypothetical protein
MYILFLVFVAVILLSIFVAMIADQNGNNKEIYTKGEN